MGSTISTVHHGLVYSTKRPWTSVYRADRVVRVSKSSIVDDYTEENKIVRTGVSEAEVTNEKYLTSASERQISAKQKSSVLSARYQQ